MEISPPTPLTRSPDVLRRCAAASSLVARKTSAPAFNSRAPITPPKAPTPTINVRMPDPRARCGAHGSSMFRGDDERRGMTATDDRTHSSCRLSRQSARVPCVLQGGGIHYGIEGAARQTFREVPLRETDVRDAHSCSGAPRLAYHAVRNIHPYYLSIRRPVHSQPCTDMPNGAPKVEHGPSISDSLFNQ